MTGETMQISYPAVHDDDDVYYYIRWRLKLEGETENMGVCTKERKGVTAVVLMATPCTNSLGGGSGGQWGVHGFDLIIARYAVTESLNQRLSHQGVS